MTPIISFDRVTYHYPGSETPALEDVSLEVEPGEVVLLAGLSGHGKSTLLRAACGLAPHHHGGRFAGRVTVAGMDTREHGPAHVGAVAGALFQDPETQLVTSAVRAELALSLESRGHEAAAVARGIEEVALALGIDALLDRSVHELSGGEQQRVALGAALAGRPQMILLDEPTSQLDPVAGDELIGLLRRLNQEWETTVLLAEHRLERCLAVADRVIALRAGRIAHDGDPASFQAWAARESPALQTPAAKLFSLAGLHPLPVGVRQARASLRERGLLPRGDDARPSRQSSESLGDSSLLTGGDASLAPQGDGRSRWRNRSRRENAALRIRGVWHELRDGPAILRGVELTLRPGETVALMGRNGAGKSTLLRHAAGLLTPTRGKIERAGRVALLLQNPGDYFIHERVREETSMAALESVGLAHAADRNPRDLSGGERQRLALAIVTGGSSEECEHRSMESLAVEPPTMGRAAVEPPAAGCAAIGPSAVGGAAIDPPAVGCVAIDSPAVLALDEPTRGMDREAKAELALELRRRAASGQAVIVATHDPEFAACSARRAVLLADGRVIADGPTSELLAGGWYFATETARILGGAGGALLPEQGVEVVDALRRSTDTHNEPAAATASPANAMSRSMLERSSPNQGDAPAMSGSVLGDLAR